MNTRVRARTDKTELRLIVFTPLFVRAGWNNCDIRVSVDQGMHDLMDMGAADKNGASEKSFVVVPKVRKLRHRDPVAIKSCRIACGKTLALHI